MEAQFRLGDLYALGHGIEQNEVAAYHWYIQSALQGYQQALVRLHDLYYAEKNIYCRGQIDTSEGEYVEDDFKKQHHIRELNEYRIKKLEPVISKIHLYFSGLLSECRKQERQKKLDKQATYLILGFLYQHGYGIRKITSRAIEYYELAADKGNVCAQYNLASIYQKHPYIKWNYHKAVHYYRLAAESGNSNAQNNLAGLYLKELGGLAVDSSKALYWYTLAAGQRNVKAKSGLVRLLRKNQFNQQDYKTVKEWFETTLPEPSNLDVRCQQNVLYEAYERYFLILLTFAVHAF
jgi:TPR repeat protein